ncbi:MAG: ATPase domain-containing protein, partial [Thermoplasmata archaeon]
MEEEMTCEICGSSMDAESSHCPNCEAAADSGKPKKKRLGRLSLARLYSGGNKAEMPETGASSEPIEPDVQSDNYPDEVISSAEGLENDPLDTGSHRDVQKVEGTAPGDPLEDVTPSESAAEAEDMLESMEEDMPDGEEDEDEKIHQLQNILSGMATHDVEGESIDLDVEKDLDRMPSVPVRARAMKVGAPSQKIQTYVEGFDELLDGGIPGGNIVLLTGEAGSMKSSLAYYILYNNILSVGAKCLYVTLEQTLESLLGQMYSMGMNPQLTQDFLRAFDMGYIRKHIAKSK